MRLTQAASFLHVPAPDVAISFSGCFEYAFMYSHHTKRLNIIATCCKLEPARAPILNARCSPLPVPLALIIGRVAHELPLCLGETAEAP